MPVPASSAACSCNNKNDGDPASESSLKHLSRARADQSARCQAKHECKCEGECKCVKLPYPQARRRRLQVVQVSRFLDSRGILAYILQLPARVQVRSWQVHLLGCPNSNQNKDKEACKWVPPLPFSFVLAGADPAVARVAVRALLASASAPTAPRRTERMQLPGPQSTSPQSAVSQ